MRMGDALARSKLGEASNHSFAPSHRSLQIPISCSRNAMMQQIKLCSSAPTSLNAPLRPGIRHSEGKCRVFAPQGAPGPRLQAQGRAVDATPSEPIMMLSASKRSKPRGSARKRGSECLHCQFAALVTSCVHISGRSIDRRHRGYLAGRRPHVGNGPSRIRPHQGKPSSISIRDCAQLVPTSVKHTTWRLQIYRAPS